MKKSRKPASRVTKQLQSEAKNFRVAVLESARQLLRVDRSQLRMLKKLEANVRIEEREGMTPGLREARRAILHSLLRFDPLETSAS